MLWASAWESGVLVLTLCIVIHTLGLNVVARFIRPDNVKERRKESLIFSILITAFVALTGAFLQSFEALIWALLYVFHHALPDLPSAFLYSMGAFSTYGNSGVSLANEWRLLGQIQAMNGIIAFGITTGFIFASAFRLHPSG
jgi:hypothetical protein